MTIQWINSETALTGGTKSPNGILKITVKYRKYQRAPWRLSWRFRTLQGILLGMGTQVATSKEKALERAEEIRQQEITNSQHVKRRREMEGLNSIH